MRSTDREITSDDILDDIDRMRGRRQRIKASRPERRPLSASTIRTRTGVAMVIAMVAIVALALWGLARLVMLLGIGISHIVLPNPTIAKTLLDLL